MTWLRIEGTPVRHFTQGDADAPPTAEARHQWLLEIGPLRASIDGENATASVLLRNRDGECSELFAAQPPIGQRASLRSASGDVFAGVVSAVNLTREVCEIGIEA